MVGYLRTSVIEREKVILMTLMVRGCTENIDDQAGAIGVKD